MIEKQNEIFVIEIEKEGERGTGGGKESTRNSIKIGEICIVPRNVG